MKETYEALEASTRKWITSLQRRFVLQDYHVRLLVLAGQAWDRAQSARRMIEEDGPVQTDRFGQKKAHPAVGIENISMLTFSKLLRETGIDLERPDDPRPKRQY